MDWTVYSSLQNAKGSTCCLAAMKV